MAERNPFLTEQDVSPLLTPNQTPSVPISRPNPFEPEGGTEHPPPATLSSNTADALRAAGNTASFGMTDRLDALRRWGLGEAGGYSEGLKQATGESAARRERSPYLSVAGDVGGGTAQAFIPGIGAVGRTTSLALGGAQTGLRGTAARAAGYGLEGGLLGAAQGAGQTYTGDAKDYVRNALVGGALGSALGAPFGHFANVAPRSLAEVPNSAALRGAARQHYVDTHYSPMTYDHSMYLGGLDALERHMGSPAVATNEVKSPKVWAALNFARTNAPYTQGHVTPYEIDAVRQQLTGVNEPGASAARQWLDNFMRSSHAVSGGTPADQAQVARSLDLARGDYRAGKRTQAVEEVNQYAGDRAEVANSGRNVGNTYGQKLTSTFLNPKSSEYKWLTPDERDMVRSTARRDLPYRVTRATGNILGGGLGAYSGTLGAGGAATAFMTGDVKPFIAGVGIPTAGYAIKSAGNRAMVRGADELADNFARNSPLYRSRAANAPMVAGPGLGNTAESTRNALTIEMMNQLKLRGYLGDPQEQP
jgi:hypothetical protein